MDNNMSVNDYFRSAAQNFVNFIHEYKIITEPALFELRQLQKYSTDKYEDYRQILRILCDFAVGNSFIRKATDKNGRAQPFDSYPIIINDTKVRNYIKGQQNKLRALWKLGNIDAHHVFIQEENYKDDLKYAEEFINNMSAFLNDFPLPEGKTQEFKNKTQNALRRLQQECSTTFHDG